jgi:hypothetical protein
MRSQFVDFYKAELEDIRSAWNDGVFIVDANVLLNLYRFPKEAADDLFAALTKIQGRLWIPHHAALEYQRNRIGVLSEQLRKFSDLRKAIAKQQDNFGIELRKLELTKRHSVISIEPLLEKIGAVVSEFVDQLEKTEKVQSSITDIDQVRERIELLLPDERVGPPFKDQAAVDAVQASGKRRYESRQPPGYEDDGKKDSFSYGGLTYASKYGDLFFWEELIDHLKIKAKPAVILITDDVKDDWLWTANHNGEKILGPRPELVEEIRRRANVETFLMYSSDRFLVFAKDILGTSLNPQSIEQVREVSQQAFRQQNRVIGQQAVMLVHRWLTTRYSENTLRLLSGFPDIVRRDGDRGRRGYEVQYIWNEGEAILRASEAKLKRFKERASEQGMDVTLVMVASGEDLANRVLHLMSRSTGQVPFIVGWVNGDGEKRAFVPIMEGNA